MGSFLSTGLASTSTSLGFSTTSGLVALPFAGLEEDTDIICASLLASASIFSAVFLISGVTTSEASSLAVSALALSNLALAKSSAVLTSSPKPSSLTSFARLRSAAVRVLRGAAS